MNDLSTCHDGDYLPAPVIDTKKAKAQLLAVLHNKDPLIAGKDAAQSLAQRNHELLNGDTQAIREALADQIALLEAVAARYTFEALASSRRLDRERACANIALKANTTLTQALLALHRVTEDQKNGQAFNG